MPQQDLDREKRIELYRSRWRRARESLRLLNPFDEAFATGGFGSRLVSGAVALFTILPADPEAQALSFDSATWTWWQTTSQQFFPDSLSLTQSAILRYSRKETTKEWLSFTALFPSVALQHGLSRAGEDRFYIVSLLKDLKKAVELYRNHVLAKFSVTGPWEISLAFRNTKDSKLMPFTYEGDYDLEAVCEDKGVLIILESPGWPADLMKQLAWRIGAAWDVPPDAVDRAFKEQRVDLQLTSGP
jgi:hypothetical protein